MIRKLRIENFKGWEDTSTIHLSPITIFLGTNSSGKSSIGHLLMALKQTIQQSDRKAVFYAGNSPVAMGTFHDLIYHRDIDKQIKFSYLWELEKRLIIKDAQNKHEYTINNIEFSASIGANKNLNNLIEVEKFNYDLRNEKQVEIAISMEKKDNQQQKLGYKVGSTGYTLKRNSGRAWDVGAPIKFYGFPDEVVAYYQNANFVQDINLEHERLFNSIYYLGPLREKAERLYPWKGTRPESVGISGQFTIDAILAASERRINMGYRRPTKLFAEVIAQKLHEMGLIDDFEVKPISKDRQEYLVRICTKGSKDWVDLPDVGFGISQVLPILVQLFYAPVGSIIIMEQPEIHLHPSAQSALADVMISAVKARENEKDRKIQLIIETHSEHLLRRLQRRIAEEAITEKDISAYFADNSSLPSKLELLQIDMFGNIVNWPKDFFGDEMGEISAHTDAALKKRIKMGY